MTTITFDLADFKKAGFEQDVLVKTFPKMGVEIEDINETEITFNITPNRPDLLDFTGLVRYLSNYTGKRMPRENFYAIKNEPVLTIEVGKEVKKVRPYIAGLVVKNADLSNNSLKYLINFTEKLADTYGRKRKKLAIGIHNFDAIKGNITYTALKDGSFVPLNARGEMGFAQIMETHEKGVEYQGTIPNYGTKKAMYPLIRDSQKILALIPITNSEATKVTEGTKNIFIDLTGTSKRTVLDIAGMIASSFLYAGADVYPVTVDYQGKTEQTPVLGYGERKVSLLRAERTLGVSLGRHDVIKLANMMGYVAAKYANRVQFYIPPFRTDVLNEQDIIEDIAIAFGYDNIAPLPIMAYGTGLADETKEFENKIAVHVAGLGYLESMNTTLTNEVVNFENMKEQYSEENYIKTADSKSSEATMVRNSLLPGLMKNLSDSLNERMPQRMFEIGRIFSLEKGEVKESLSLALVSEHAKANFSEIRSVVDNVLRYLEVDYKIEPAESDSFIAGRCASVFVNGQSIGMFGEMHPDVLQNFKIEEPVVGAEITLIKEIKYETQNNNGTQDQPA